MGEVKHTPWEEAAEQLCSAVEKRIEGTARKAAESLYEDLLYDTQAYLRENALLNLQSELDSARRAEADAREALRTIAVSAGISGHNYAGDTAQAVVAAIAWLRNKAAAAYEMKRALDPEVIGTAARHIEKLFPDISGQLIALADLQRAALAKANGEGVS